MVPAYVFLDIDGVLNTRKNYIDFYCAGRRNLEKWKCDELLFDPKNVDVLNAITSEVGAKIVISSSWRLLYASRWEELKELLVRVGITAPIIGRTPVSNQDRGSAIDQWLDENESEREVRFVILDDEEPYVFSKRTRSHLCHTNPAVGLVESDIKRSMKILKKNFKPGKKS